MDSPVFQSSIPVESHIQPIIVDFSPQWVRVYCKHIRGDYQYIDDPLAWLYADGNPEANLDLSKYYTGLAIDHIVERHAEIAKRATFIAEYFQSNKQEILDGIVFKAE